MQNKILLIQPYFGKLPNYFPLWLDSAKRNDHIDFLLLTDDKLQVSLPSNVIYIKMTLTEFNELANNKLKTTVNLSKPYKICDLKPLYALIFDDFLKGYSHWGYFDLDMYFGDLRKFLTVEMLSTIPKIGVYAHLTIFKNEDDLNRMFLTGIKDFPYDLKEILMSPKNYNAGEMGGINIMYDLAGLRQSELPIIDVDSKLKKWKAARVNAYYQMFYVNAGKTFMITADKNKNVNIKEVAYIHYQKRKIHDLEYINFNQPFYFSETGVLNFEMIELEQILFNQSFPKGYLLFHRFIKIFKRGWKYATGQANYPIKIRRMVAQWKKSQKLM